MMKKILLTGSNGFTGKYISTELKKSGYEIVGLVKSRAGGGEIECDITDKDAVIEIVSRVKPDGVIHLAALSFVGHKEESAFYSVNTVGTVNLLDALYKSGFSFQKIIIASSANVYGNPVLSPITEDAQAAPVNHYAMSKLAMEYMVKNYFPLLPIIITRPFNYTGVDQDKNFLVPKIVEHFREKKTSIELGNLDVARDFSDVRDIAMAYVKLYESDVISETFNLSSGRTYELGEIIESMQKIAGYEIDVKVNLDFVRENEIKTLSGSCDKLDKLVGYSPKYDLLDTLQDMYKS